MANILDKYGIKEVADVTFYDIDTNGNPTVPVLYLDTLKVSTIEQTADSVSARGGKGNPELIKWDFGKEITVNLEDALFSAKSMAIMYGVDTNSSNFNQSLTSLLKTVPASSIKTSSWTVGSNSLQIEVGGNVVTLNNVSYYEANGTEAMTTGTVDNVAYVTGDVAIKDATEIHIGADNFPGTYYVTGDTYARHNVTGDDEFFQFIIPKAKMQSEVTLTLEAEGDPSTFNMSLTVLRPDSGPMMKLVKYNLA